MIKNEKTVNQFNLDSINDNKEKFDLVVGNPPYHLKTKRDGFNSAVYYKYMEVSQKYADTISLVYPSRWMQGGTGIGIKEFRDKELFSKKYEVFYDFPGEKQIFENNNIISGINVFLWKNNKNFNYEEHNNIVQDNENDLIKCYYVPKEIIKRNVLTIGRENVPIHVRDLRFVETVENVYNKSNQFMDEIVHSRAYYGKNFSSPAVIEKLIEPKENEESLKVYYTKPGHNVITRKVYPDKTEKNSDNWKVFVSKIAHAAPNKTIPRPDRLFIGEPNSICSDTYIKIGDFETKIEVENCIKYLKSNFISLLIGLTISSLTISKKNFLLTPLIDFKTGEIKIKKSDKVTTETIVFDKDNLIDEQLYEIFEISNKLRETIAAEIKSWENKTKK